MTIIMNYFRCEDQYAVLLGAWYMRADVITELFKLKWSARAGIEPGSSCCSGIFNYWTTIVHWIIFA